MKTNSLRLWRVAFWGVITFILFSVLFWHGFHLFLNLLIERKTAFASVLPSPVLPSMLAGVLVLFFVALGMVACWRFHLWRRPASPHSSFTSHQGNAELCLRLILLVLLLIIGLCLSNTSHMDACRCCLFTAEPACQHGSLRLPPEGYYRFSNSDGWHFGSYANGEKEAFKAGKIWLDKFGLEDVRVTRTRFGWPIRAITRDAVSQKPEWHMVVEVYAVANLITWFVGWLCLQPILSKTLGRQKEADRSDTVL